MNICRECYSEKNRITPLLKPQECLEKHLQYVCGSCGRCICIAKDEKRNVQRWNFPFKSLDIAILYLRAADFTMKKYCGIYKIVNSKGRVSYKIFVSIDDLKVYLAKNKDKNCELMEPIYIRNKYEEFKDTKIKYLSKEEIKLYLSERK